MSKVFLQRIFPIIIVLAIWTLFFIQIPFGATELPSVISGSYTDSTGGAWYGFMGMKAWMTKEFYQAVLKALESNHAKLRSIAEELGQVSTPVTEGQFEIKNAVDCLKEKDFSFVPYLFKDDEIQSLLKVKMLHAQTILRAERLPEEFRQLIVMAAKGKRLGRMKSASFQDMVFLELQLGHHFSLVYDTLMDMDMLANAVKHPSLRTRIFSDAFQTHEAASSVYHFFKKLEHVIESHVTDLIFKSLIGDKFK